MIKLENVQDEKIIQFSFTQIQDGLLIIDENHVFETEGQRIDYFSNNPDERKVGRVIIVDGQLQQWTGSEWKDIHSMTVGKKGDPGPMPNHQIHENYPTRIAFEKPDGQFGDYMDLKGPEGDMGPIPEHQWTGTQLRFEKSSGDWGPWVGLKGDRGDSGPSGDSFKVDKTGKKSDRSNYDGEDEGFSFLATDEGLLYFRQGSTGNWSDPVPFHTKEQLRRKVFRQVLLMT